MGERARTGMKSLGTLGSGNRLGAGCRWRQDQIAANAYGLREGQVTAMIHGSRALDTGP